MSARGDILHLRLFICGVEVPVIGAMVSATEGSPAAAQIEIIPTDRALRLLPRSKVHLFFLDYDQVQQAGDPGVDVGKDGAWGRNDLYKLLFSGELFTLSYTKTGYGSRSVVLQCLDDSNLWDTSYLYMLRYENSDTGDGAIVQDRHNFVGAGAALSDVLGQAELKVASWASREAPPYSPSLQSTRGIVGGLFSVLELIGGLPGKYVGVTAWHTIQEARVRLMDQCAGDSGQTAEQLYELSVFENWLATRLGDRGTVISFRDIINMVNQYIFYSVVPNPVARYVPGERKPPEWPAALGKGGAAGLNPEFSQLVEALMAEVRKKYPATRLTSGHRSLEHQVRILMKRPGVTREEATRKAVGYPHVSGYAVDIGGHTAKGIGYVTLQEGYTSKDSFQNKTLGSYSIHKKCQYYVNVEGITTVDQLRTKLTADELAQIALAAEFYAHVGSFVGKGQFAELEWLGRTKDPGAGGARDLMWEIAGLGFDPVHVQMKGWRSRLGTLYGDRTAFDAFIASLPPRERLISQYFRPDCWFVVPPRCNVVFPEEVTSFSFSRQMMRETTRLQLMTHNTMLGDSSILNQSYFAPNYQNTKSLTSNGAGGVEEQVVYPHEVYSGIIPKLERISDVAIYSRFTGDDEPTKVPATTTAQKKGAQDPPDGAETQMDVWAARTAAFNFLSYRYASRMCTVTGRFMPRLVCGFPALILDRGVEQHRADTNAILPTHFLGMVRSVTHSLSQSGGTTSITLSHARSHKNIDETDGLPDDLFVSQTTTARAFKKVIAIREGMREEDFQMAAAINNEVKAAILSGLLDDDHGFDPEVIESMLKGPRGGTISNLVLRTSTGSDLLRTPLLIETGADGTTVIADSIGELETTTGSPASGAALIEPYFYEVSYTETVGTAGLTLSLEDAILPPWFSDEYLSDSIGDLYREFFGCSSMLAINGQADIESSTDALAAEYGKRTAAGTPTASWIHAHTKRTYATMSEVLGTRSKPGFHRFASGDYTKLDNLHVTPTGAAQVPGAEPFLATQFEPDVPRTVPPELDPRGGRHAKAAAYAAELSTLRGLRG